MFKKENLKNGDIVTYRDGRRRRVKSNKLLGEDESPWNCLKNYDDDLKDKEGAHDLDIVKVERLTRYETVFERKEEILDEAEKRYLRGVIRPFRNKVLKIVKKYDLFTELEYIRIIIKDDASLEFPSFSKNTMYKNMETNKSYTLEELGL